MALAHTCMLRLGSLPTLDLRYILCRVILLEGEKMQYNGQSKQIWVIISLTPKASDDTPFTAEMLSQTQKAYIQDLCALQL